LSFQLDTNILNKYTYGKSVKMKYLDICRSFERLQNSRKKDLYINIKTQLLLYRALS